MRHWGNGEQLVRAIIIANIVMFLISILLNPRMTGMSTNPLRFFSPSMESLAALGATGRWLITNTHGWWTLVSANYLHGSFVHILFNLIALYQISPLISQVYGPYRYFIIFTISGIAGFFVSYVAGIQITIGASAALCGLIGAALYFGKSRGGPFGQAIYKQIGVWGLSIIIFGLLIQNVNNWAHIGGMAAGALTGFLIGYREKKRETLNHRRLAGLLVIVTITTLLWGVCRGVFYLIIK